MMSFYSRDFGYQYTVVTKYLVNEWMNKELQASDKEKGPQIYGQTQKMLKNSRILEWKLTDSTCNKY